jgi:drug/metabolite transporter superfamily protein YnfA
MILMAKSLTLFIVAGLCEIAGVTVIMYAPR